MKYHTRELKGVRWTAHLQFLVQDIKVSLEYVDFYTKESLILDAQVSNSTTPLTLVNILSIFAQLAISKFFCCVAFLYEVEWGIKNEKLIFDFWPDNFLISQSNPKCYLAD